MDEVVLNVLCRQITSLWQFYLYYGVVVGVGLMALGFIPHVSLISRWFVRQRGLANSLALAGQGVGILVLAPVSESLIATYGWRQSYQLYGVLIPGLLIPLILMWQRHRPASLGLATRWGPRAGGADARCCSNSRRQG